MSHLWLFLRRALPHWRWMLLGWLVSLIATLAGIGLLATAGWLITASALAGLAGAGVMFNFFTPGALVRAFSGLRIVGRYGERVITHEATFRLIAGLRVWLFSKAIPLAPAQLGLLRGGDLLSRLTADIDALDALYLRILVPVSVFTLVLLGAGLWLGYAMAPVAGLVVAGGLLIAGLALPWAMAVAGWRVGRHLPVLGADVRTLAVDGVQGMADLLAFGGETRHLAQMAQHSQALIHAQQRMTTLAGLGGAGLGLIANLTMWVAVLVGVGLLRAGAIAGPDLVLLTFMALAVFEAAAPLPMAAQLLGRVTAAAQRLGRLAETRPDIVDAARPGPLPVGNRLDFNAVRFGYTPGRVGRPVLDGVDLHLAPGRRVAVIGPSGAGKSTLLALALRFWDVQGGQITLDGMDIRHLPQEAVRSRMALVDQQPHLFAGTIAENLLLARPNATDSQLWQALQTARLDEFVATLPDGLQTYVGEGALCLSGGQARRLAVARAVLKDAPILLLDEPATGLDPDTEAQMMAALDYAMRGRAVLMITHRLTGLEQWDEILVLKGGKVVEQGSHPMLMSLGGHYARLKRATL